MECQGRRCWVMNREELGERKVVIRGGDAVLDRTGKWFAELILKVAVAMVVPLQTLLETLA
jgi:hypothetical protein